MKQYNGQDNDNADAKRCLQWMDLQPTRLVVYVSFGSSSTVSDYQIMKLAIGLEGSGKFFLSELGNSMVVSEGFDPSMVPWESAFDAFFWDKNVLVDQEGLWQV